MRPLSLKFWIKIWDWRGKRYLLFNYENTDLIANVYTVIKNSFFDVNGWLLKINTFIIISYAYEYLIYIYIYIRKVYQLIIPNSLGRGDRSKEYGSESNKVIKIILL